MATLTASMILSPKLKPSFEQQGSLYVYTRSRKSKKRQSLVPVIFYCLINWLCIVFFFCVAFCDLWWVFVALQVARLFGPAIFEASKLKVLFLGVDEKKNPGNLPRTYTLTHSDITSKITLAISHTINNSQVCWHAYILSHLCTGTYKDLRKFNIKIKINLINIKIQWVHIGNWKWLWFCFKIFFK